MKPIFLLTKKSGHQAQTHEIPMLLDTTSSKENMSFDEVVILDERFSFQFSVLIDEPAKDVVLVLGDDEISLEKINDFKFSQTDSLRYLEGFFGEICPRLLIDGIGYKPKVLFEVVTNKISAEQIQELLNGLFEKEHKLLFSEFSPTKKHLSEKEGLLSFEAFFNKTKKTIDIISQLSTEIFNHPQKKLRKKDIFKEILPSSHTGATTFNWILGNMSALIPSHSERSCITLKGRKKNITFEIPNGKISDSFQSTDTYENRLIHFYLEQVELEILNVIEYLKGKKDNFLQKSRYKENGNHLSFRAVLNGSLDRLIDIRIKQLHGLKDTSNNLLANFRKLVPVSRKAGLHEIKLTKKAQQSQVYRTISQEILSWIKQGEYKSELGREFVSLRSLSDLYEFYCLFVLLDEISSLTLANPVLVYESAGPQLELTRKYLFELEDNKKIHLAFNHPIEENEDETIGLRCVKFNTKYYKPDFVIKITNGERSGIIILDAKYSKSSKYYLDKLIVKYLHGLSPIKGCNVLGMYIISLSDKQSSQGSFFKKAYRTSGREPIFPTIERIFFEPKVPTTHFRELLSVFFAHLDLSHG